jgi:hypothetical protein
MNPFDLPSVQTPEDEEARERRWWNLETELIEFAKIEGWPAVLRAVSRAMSEQKALIRQ